MLFKWKKCSNCQGYHDPTLEKCPHCHKHNELYLDRQINFNVAFMHPVAQIGLFLAGFSFAGMLIAELIVALLLNSIEDKLLFSTLLISITYLVMFLGLSLIVILTRRDHFFKKYRRAIDYIYGLGYAITLVLVSMIVATILNLFHPVSENANQEAAVSFAQGYPILAFFILGLIGPICEELTYRVGLYSFLRRFNKWVALGVTAFVFAFIHFDVTGDLVKELWSFPSYLVSGVILTLAYEHRGPACSMTAHIAYNIFAFAIMLAA